jgi:hypothetical protein
MNLSRIYKKIIKLGSEQDPRPNKPITSYSDTAILYGNLNTEVKKIMVGIDIEVGELLLADRVRKLQGLDLVISHHPEGKAWASFFEVMKLQVDLLAKAGISRKAAQQMLEERMREVERKVLPNNHMRAVDAARILGLPFMCVHTPADNHAFSFMQKLMAKEKPRKVGDTLDILMTVPEYKLAAKDFCGPRIISGNPHRGVGKIFCEMTGGTEGPLQALEKFSQAGVKTMICMHMSEEHFKKVKDANLNVVIAGHISSDTLGLNLLLDSLEQSARQKFQTTDCSGFRRIRRF